MSFIKLLKILRIKQVYLERDDLMVQRALASHVPIIYYRTGWYVKISSLYHSYMGNYM